jgi:hypothetical protein
LKSSSVPLLHSNPIQYDFPKLTILTRNTQSTLLTEPDHLSSIVGRIDTNSSDLILIKDSRLFSSEIFVSYPLLSPYFTFLLHEIISFFHFHSKNPLYSSLILSSSSSTTTTTTQQQLFSEKLSFLELDSRLLKFYSQQITFPTLSLAQATHRLIAAINSREGMLSDLIGAYLMSTDLVPPVMSRQKRKISSFASDHSLFSIRTKKKARFVSSTH